MLLNRCGSAHKIMFGLIVFVGFGLALGYPQFKKHQTLASAQRAVDLGRAMAFAETEYKAQHGAYTADFAQLALSLPCPMETTEEGTFQLVCPHYVYELNGEIITVKHTQLPKWFEINITQGTVECSHEEGSMAGSHICARVNLVAPLVH